MQKHWLFFRLIPLRKHYQNRINYYIKNIFLLSVKRIIKQSSNLNKALKNSGKGNKTFLSRGRLSKCGVGVGNETQNKRYRSSATKYSLYLLQIQLDCHRFLSHYAYAIPSIQLCNAQLRTTSLCSHSRPAQQHWILTCQVRV